MGKITGAYRNMLGQVEFHEQKLPLKNPGAFMPAVIVVGERNDEVPKVFTESEVDELIKAGNAMSVAMYQYEMDVDDDPPQKHRDMMNAWEAAVRRLRDPA